MTLLEMAVARESMLRRAEQLGHTHAIELHKTAIRRLLRQAMRQFTTNPRSRDSKRRISVAFARAQADGTGTANCGNGDEVVINGTFSLEKLAEKVLW